MIKRFAAVLFLFAAALGAVENCQADGWFWGGGGYGGNRWYDSGREIPYFAEHPPVYYSHIVPRTYGQSPYAYWPGPFTPVLSPEPIMIDNPYAPLAPEEVAPPAPSNKPARPKKKSASTDVTTGTSRSSGPLVVLNPFAEAQTEVAASSK